MKIFNKDNYFDFFNKYIIFNNNKLKNVYKYIYL